MKMSYFHPLMRMIYVIHEWFSQWKRVISSINVLGKWKRSVSSTKVGTNEKRDQFSSIKENDSISLRQWKLSWWKWLIFIHMFSCGFIHWLIHVSSSYDSIHPSIHPGFEPMKKIHFIYKAKTNEKNGPFSSINDGNQWRKWFHFIMGPMIMINFILRRFELMKMAYFSSTCCCVPLHFWFHSLMLIHVSSNYEFFFFHLFIHPVLHAFIHSFIHQPTTPVLIHRTCERK